jgi:hypothetical protein
VLVTVMTPMLSISAVALLNSSPVMLGTILTPVITQVLSTSRTMMRHYVVFVLMFVLMFVLVSMVYLVLVVFLVVNGSINILPIVFVMLHVLMRTANSLDKNCGQETREEKLHQDAFATSATRRSR